MSSYAIKIASYIIRFIDTNSAVKLVPSQSQKSFLTNETESDLIINVDIGNTDLPGDAIQVFSAPYVEEINGVEVKVSDRFWRVYTHGENILVNTTMPLSESAESALLTIRGDSNMWDLVINSTSSSIDPFTYPLDGLILYYLTALRGDIFIHGSAVEYGGRGFLFTGKSGRGKTTIAGIFRDAGAVVIHDDRVIIRSFPENVFKIYNTPIYDNEISREVVLSKIYLIEHGPENEALNQGRSESLALIMANSIQHNWNRTLIGNLTGSLHKLVTHLPVKRLKFVPDSTVIDYIRGDDH
jgi:hypothetical protein